MTAEVEVPSWLNRLSLAPEYHPTEAEFSDPIDYIFRIEPEAAQFGICKIVPPYHKASKPVVFHNLNLSLANSQDEPPPLVVGRNMCPARSMGGMTATTPVGLGLDLVEGAGTGGKARFTTRRQQLGWNTRKVRTGQVPQAVAHKLVWQSGETYTLDQFEAKAKSFARNKLGSFQHMEPLPIEALFWKASLEKAISIEYANDIPGSAFAEPRESRRREMNGECLEEEEKARCEKDMAMSGDEVDAFKGAGVEAENERSIGCKLSNSAWNMRRVARSPGSLLRFIPDEVPGVTSPMVYIGMLFSWFAWHVEDHELHSLNYLHTGAPKTWYAVPGDAAPALEEVVRVQGYGGNISAQEMDAQELLSSTRGITWLFIIPPDAFARLGEKTTVMSPEVLVAAGVPCCRLVQNAGEYVVTFPRAYHLGFSHGFNCGEAANFATPGWLKVAREASVRRAAMKYLPMLSHQQLLYTLAASLISRSLVDIACEKRSSRLKEKKRDGEEEIKSMFVNDAIQQNDMIGKLLDNKVASCLLVRDLKHYAPYTDTNLSDADMTLKTCKLEEKQEQAVPEGDALESPASERPNGVPSSAFESMPFQVLVEEKTESHEVHDIRGTMETEQVCGGDLVTSALPRDLSTLPCAACGILCYTGMAIVQPSQIAATKLLPLHSYASGPGSYRSKGVISPSSGVLPGKADKKSADFHMLPSVECQPLLELEGTTPDIFADASYEDLTEEPEVWTPDLKECPTTYKNCSNDATLDAELPRSDQTSTVSERDEYFSPEVAKAVSSVGNDGVTPNINVGEAMEIEKQNHEIVSGLGSAFSGDPVAQVSNARATLCSIESNPVVEGTLSSLQLLAATYEGDSDIDEYDEIEHADAGNFMCGHLTVRSSNSEIISNFPVSEESKPSAVILLSPPGSQTLALKGTASSVVELSEEHLKSGVEMDNCKRTCNALEETARSLLGSASCQPNDKHKDGDTAAGDEAKPKSALSFGECVTCSLPHDSFFDSFEEVTLKSVENGTMELDNSSDKNEVVVNCDENPKICALLAPEADLESNDPVGIPCTSLVEAGSLLAEASSVTTGSCSKGDPLDHHASLPAIQHPDLNGVREARGLVEPMQMESNVPTQLPNLKGAARPRMLCLEHAVAAQKSLESIGGSTVIIICHSSFPKVEEQAKAVAAEVGASHEWRSVPFKQAGDEDYKIITAAVEAQEEFLPGDKDWVDQLGLSVHGQCKSLSNDVEIANGNPSSEESEDPGNRRIWKGRKEKKSSIIRKWCGRGWRADQLHSLLGGKISRSTYVQIDSTAAPANLCTSAGVSSFVESGRSRKIMRPARYSEYTPDGRAPKGESHTKKSCNKRKILLEMSEDEYDEQSSQAAPSRQGGSHDGFNPYGSIGDSQWREVPIASTDSLLLPLHLSGADMTAEKEHDDFLFAPQSLFHSENEIRLSASEANTNANISMNNGASQSCAVVGGFVQRGAKLIAQQKLQKLCRQLSTPVSVPCTPLTTPARFSSWVKPSHKRISAAKLVNRLKRKPATELSRYSKKQRVREGGEQKIQRVSLSRRASGEGHGEGIISNVSVSENNIMSVSDEEAKKDLFQDNDTPSRGDEELNTNISNSHSETTAGGEYEKLKLCDNVTQHVQDCTSRFIGNTDSSPSKSISQQYHYEIQDPPNDKHYLSDKTPNIDPNSMSILMYCTESLPQGLNEQTTRESAEAASIVYTEPVVVPRKGRVRGKRTKSRQWKSCLQMPSSKAEEPSLSPTCDENRTSGDGSDDLGSVEPKLSPEGRRDSGAHGDPDFFPYLSSTTSVRRRRICTPGMADWGADKDGNNGEAEGSADDHPSVQQQHQGTKLKKRKNGPKSSAKRCEDLEGEFQCDMEGCIMAFDSIRDLQLHKKNLCTWKGCGKHFHMHKYLLQHRRVHLDDRPLKCPVKGCTQAFKWAWARTEHIRVHTGERPYKCMVSGCGQTFRFVSDFSRHKRNTGHRPT